MKRLITAVCLVCVLGVVDVSAAQATRSGQGDDEIHGRHRLPRGEDGHYMLNAMMAGDTKAMSYDLMGGEPKAHVGHKVEVTGRSNSKTGKMDAKKWQRSNRAD